MSKILPEGFKKLNYSEVTALFKKNVHEVQTLKSDIFRCQAKYVIDSQGEALKNTIQKYSKISLRKFNMIIKGLRDIPSENPLICKYGDFVAIISDYQTKLLIVV